LSVPTSTNCHLCYGFFLEITLNVQRFLKLFFWQSADEKFRYSEGQEKKSTPFVLVFYSPHAWQKNNKKNLTNSTEPNPSCKATISVR
jgi:hypothetical protein